MDLAEFNEIKKGLDKASDSNRPIISEDNDGKNIAIVGNANDTESKETDYIVEFFLTEDMISNFPYDPDSVEKIGEEYKLSVSFPKRKVTPRIRGRLTAAAYSLYPFYNKINDDGSLAELSEDERNALFLANYNDFDLAMYNIIAQLLGINDYYGEYMLPGNVFQNVIKLMENNPEVFNESYSSFQ